MGNNANSIPTGGGTAFRSNIKYKDHEPDSMPWGSPARRTDSGQNAVKLGEEVGGRPERAAEPVRHIGGDVSNTSRHSSSIHERHAVWAPRSSPQNVVGGRDALLYHPTIEIQPLTDELLMAELPKHKKKILVPVQFHSRKPDTDERLKLPGLNKPYSKFQKSNGKTLVKDVCNKISVLKAAIVSPQVQKKDLPGIGSPFGDFTQEKKIKSELWPSLANTAHFEQYMPKQNREPDLIETVENDLKNEMVKVKAKQLKEVKKSEESYLVELKKDLLKMTCSNVDESAQPDSLHLELIKQDLSNNKEDIKVQQTTKIDEGVKYVWQDNLPASDNPKCPETISKEGKKVDELEKMPNDLLINFKSDRILRKQIHQNRIRKIEINVPEEVCEDNSFDETLMDSFEDMTLQEFSEMDNSLARIPDFPKDETETKDGPSVTHDKTVNPITGFESRPFDLTKVINESPSAPPFKPKFFKNGTQSVPKKKVGDMKDLTLVEHGYAKKEAKKELKRFNSESSKKAGNEKSLDYEHSYVKDESPEGTGKDRPFLVFCPNCEGADNRRRGVRTANAEISVENKESRDAWASIAKFYERREESQNQSSGDNPVGDWVRLENLSKANKKPSFSSTKPTRPF